MMMTRASMGAMEGPVLDDVIRRLLGGGGRQVKLFEAEIRQLCVEAKKVFLSQPNLLELHAPIKICAREVALQADSIVLVSEIAL
ncbi:hypothetical protein C4D60_Mb11t11820 [Musa balbisiana]|uniref:Serine-threonine protein phosphatase N-terminal domain-containing protein n=1 Tax=Musa balbisiana TaxID=52838 RepID=A0A4S8J3F4_MUSBA|nr:hypothetical protein C4D60_Mb11t11820 [Musa balbisiana]